MKVVLLDNNFAIRQLLKVLISKVTRAYGHDLQLYTDDDGIEGLGYILVVKPELVIIDATLPRYSGKELVDFIASNPSFAKQRSKVIVLFDSDTVPTIRYQGFSYIRKDVGDSLKQIALEITDVLESAADMTSIESRLTSGWFGKLAGAILGLASSTDKWLRKADKTPNIILRLLWLVLSSIAQFGLAVLVSTLYLFYERPVDTNKVKATQDANRFRTRYYPSLISFFVILIMLLLQVGAIVAGGLVVFNLKISSIFASMQGEIVYNFHLDNQSEFTYDSDLVEFTEDGVQLKIEVPAQIIEPVEVPEVTPLLEEIPETEVPTPTDPEVVEVEDENETVSPETQTELLAEPEEAVPDSDIDVEHQLPEVLGISSESYSIDNPMIAIKTPVAYSDLIGFEETSSYSSLEDGTEQLDTTEITYQLSPDAESWYYWEGVGEEPGWSETTNGWQSSSTVDELNQNLEQYEVLFESGELYIRAYLHTGSKLVTPILEKLVVKRNLDVVVTIDTEAEPEDQAVIEPEVVVPKLNIEFEKLETVIFNASFYNGNKIVKGKVLPKKAGQALSFSQITQEQISSYQVRIYYSDSKKGTRDELIGSTGLYVNNRGELEFLIRTPSRAGGFVTAEVIEKASGEAVSGLAKPVENSTFTVDSTGDGADSGLDGLCDDGGGNCTLRAAIEEANNVGGQDNIDFNISSSDTGYRDYDLAGTPSSGDGANGDDYWTIEPATALPTISSEVVIDGGTQTINQSDTNTSGPEVEINGVNIGGFTDGLFINTGGTSSEVHGLSVNRFSRQIRTRAGDTKYTLNYLGTDVRGEHNASYSNQELGIEVEGTFFVHANPTIIGNTTTDGNVIGGFVHNLSGISKTGVLVYCDIGTNDDVSINGNYIGVNRNNNAIPNTTYGVRVEGNCDLDLGGASATERNYISNNSSGLNISLSGTTAVQEIYNNYFGTDTTGTVDYGNTTAINVSGQNELAAHTPIQIGDIGQGNLMRYNNTGFYSTINRDVNIEGNTISAERKAIELIGLSGGTYDYTGINISNNYISTQSGGDPYFGLVLNDVSPTPWDHRGIDILGMSPTIKGNYINGYSFHAIQVRKWQDNINTPEVGGQAVYANSLCNGLEQNCITDNGENNQGAGIYIFDTLVLNDATLYADNDFINGNGQTNEINIEQAWQAGFELLSDTYRRTDLADKAFSINIQDDYPNFLIRPSYSSYPNRIANCTDPLDCPLAGPTTGTDGQTGMINNQFSTSFSSLIVVEYQTDNSGIRTQYGEIQFEEPHFVSDTFSYDGDSTTHGISTDRGQVWTNDDTATRDPVTKSVGFAQVMEVEFVDANPIWDGAEWVVTVDSTGDDDNISSVGYDDGSGAYSGGGTVGPDGPADGSTTLREAIIVANSFANPVTIEFNIPTSDAGYRDYDDPNTPSSGDSTDGDDFWRISPSSSFPVISGDLTIDGSSQTTNILNSNTSGPEVELNGTSAGFVTGLNFQNSDNSVDGLVINSYSYGIVLSNVSGFELTGSYIGLDPLGLAADLNSTGGVSLTGSDINIGTASSGNVISGNMFYGVRLGDSTNVTIENNVIGLDPTGLFAIENRRSGIRVNNASSVNLRIIDNIISGNGQTDFYGGIEIDGDTINRPGPVTIVGNRIGVDITGNVAVENGWNGVEIINYSNVQIGGMTAVERNTISGNLGDGIYFVSVNDSTVEGNYLGLGTNGTSNLGNGIAGLELSYGHDVVVSENYITGSTYGGVGLYGNTLGSGEELYDNTFDSNYIGIDTNDNPAPNGTHGFYVSNYVYDHLFEDNVIANNPNNGFYFLAGALEGNTVRNNIFRDNGDIAINLVGGTEDSYGITADDVGDVDTGPNDLQNSPEIKNVSYLGNGGYQINGDIDGQGSEGPFTIEICANYSPHASEYGGCEIPLGTTTANSPWSKTVSLAGSNGSDGLIFSALATNINGSTSEFGPNYDTATEPSYGPVSYIIPLIYPIGDVSIIDRTPLFDWARGRFEGILDPEVDHYEVYLDGVFYASVSGDSTEYESPTKLSLGEHKWQVVSFRAGNVESGRSLTESFEIIELTVPVELQPAVMLVYPTNVEIDSKSPTFIWEWVSNGVEASSYKLYLSGAAEHEWGAESSSLPSPEELVVGEYEWYVEGYNEADELLATSEVAEFSIVKVEDVPITEVVPPEVDEGPEDPISPSTNLIPTWIWQVIPGILLVLGILLADIGIAGSTLGVNTSALGPIIGVLFGYLFQRKRKYWGLVYEVEKNSPLAFATVRLYDSHSRIRYQTVTDLKGRYGFLPDFDGPALVQVDANGYQSRAERITVDMEQEVAIDFGMQLQSGGSGLLSKVKIGIHNPGWYAFINVLILVLILFGLVYSLYALYISPVLINILIMIGYLVVFAANVLIFVRSRRVIGRVEDASTQKPLPAVRLRFYQEGNAVGIALTDQWGRIKENLSSGQYKLMANKGGYQPLSEDSFMEIKPDGTMGEDVSLSPISGVGKEGVIDANLSNPFQ